MDGLQLIVPLFGAGAESGDTGVVPPGLAVEEARKRSPEKCEPVVPVRARPSVTRRRALALLRRRTGHRLHDRDDRAPPRASRRTPPIGLSSASS